MDDDDDKRCSGHAVYTASWTAARADVHSQQRFFCLMEEGEVIKKIFDRTLIVILVKEWC